MAYHHPSYWNCFLMFLWGIPPFLDNTNIILFGFLYHSYAILPMKSSWNPRLPRCGWSRKQPENGASLGGARWCPFSVKLSREPWEEHTVFGGIPMVKPWRMVMQWNMIGYEWTLVETMGNPPISHVLHRKPTPTMWICVLWKFWGSCNLPLRWFQPMPWRLANTPVYRGHDKGTQSRTHIETKHLIIVVLLKLES